MWAVVSIGTTVLGSIIKIIDSAEVWTVEIHNEGRHHAHMWCASADDKIGGDDGVWVKPGDKIAWSFHRKATTQFWCNMDWYGQRVGWDVFVTNWKDAPNPTKWSIRDDGVYDQWRNRKWRNLNRTTGIENLMRELHNNLNSIQISKDYLDFELTFVSALGVIDNYTNMASGAHYFSILNL